MVNAVPDILARIVEHKRAELENTGRRRLRGALDKRVEQWVDRRRDFKSVLTQKAPAIIAEMKKASPSKGRLVEEYDPRVLARQYEEGGAAALSVLTEQEFFKGCLLDLWEAKAAVSLPALRKDFTIDDFHVTEAAAYGADAILLIAAILTREQMEEFRVTAAAYGMAALVEVHNEAELKKALDSGAEIIGVNNRDLHTFEVSLDTSRRLAEHIPDHVVKVSESGIATHADVSELQRFGYQAFLVGEHLITSVDPEAAVRGLRL